MFKIGTKIYTGRCLSWTTNRPISGNDGYCEEAKIEEHPPRIEADSVYARVTNGANAGWASWFVAAKVREIPK